MRVDDAMKLSKEVTRIFSCRVYTACSRLVFLLVVCVLMNLSGCLCGLLSKKGLLCQRFCQHSGVTPLFSSCIKHMLCCVLDAGVFFWVFFFLPVRLKPLRTDRTKPAFLAGHRSVKPKTVGNHSPRTACVFPCIVWGCVNICPTFPRFIYRSVWPVSQLDSFFPDCHTRSLFLFPLFLHLSFFSTTHLRSWFQSQRQPWRSMKRKQKHFPLENMSGSVVHTNGWIFTRDRERSPSIPARGREGKGVAAGFKGNL